MRVMAVKVGTPSLTRIYFLGENKHQRVLLGIIVAASDGTPVPEKKKLGLIRRRIAILPTLCTLCNAACGLGALVCAAHLNVAEALDKNVGLYVSGCLIFVAMI